MSESTKEDQVAWKKQDEEAMMEAYYRWASGRGPASTQRHAWKAGWKASKGASE